MHEIKAIIRRDRVEAVLDALHEISDLPGITLSTVTGVGRRLPHGSVPEFGEVMMTKLEVVVPEAMLAAALTSIRRAAHSGHAGDGKVFVSAVQQAWKIRSDTDGPDAL